MKKIILILTLSVFLFACEKNTEEIIIQKKYHSLELGFDVSFESIEAMNLSPEDPRNPNISGGYVMAYVYSEAPNGELILIKKEDFDEGQVPSSYTNPTQFDYEDGTHLPVPKGQLKIVVEGLTKGMELNYISELSENFSDKESLTNKFDFFDLSSILEIDLTKLMEYYFYNFTFEITYDIATLDNKDLHRKYIQGETTFNYKTTGTPISITKTITLDDGVITLDGEVMENPKLIISHLKGFDSQSCTIHAIVKNNHDEVIADKTSTADRITPHSYWRLIPGSNLIDMSDVTMMFDFDELVLTEEEINL